MSTTCWTSSPTSAHTTWGFAGSCIDKTQIHWQTDVHCNTTGHGREYLVYTQGNALAGKPRRGTLVWRANGKHDQQTVTWYMELTSCSYQSTTDCRDDTRHAYVDLGRRRATLWRACVNMGVLIYLVQTRVWFENTLIEDPCRSFWLFIQEISSWNKIDYMSSSRPIFI